MLVERARTHSSWRRWLRRLVGAALMVLALPGGGIAQDVATAQKVVNDVWGGGLAWRVQPQRKLRFREQINVAASSGIEFRLVDGTSLSVGENSEIRLDEFVYDPSRNAVDGTLKFARGAMRFVGSAASKNVTVELPTGTIGVRGTVFNVRADRSKFEVEVLSGSVEVTSGGAQRQVSAGEFVRAAGASILQSQPPPEFRAAIGQINRTLGPPPTERVPNFAPSPSRR